MIARITQRDPDEHHRASTPLELFVDLASVIGIATAAGGLHHAISEAHYGDGVVSFLCAFFGIWWAWMNYTWFASAYDDHSIPYKVATFVFLSGSLVMAAGVEGFMTRHALDVVAIGYLIMRFAMVYLWLAAARGSPSHRTTCLRYAGGIAVCQAFWILLIFGFWEWTPPMIGLFALCALCEVSVPYWAERANITPWHRHHMIERYGLLIIIVLGEMLLAIASAVKAAADATEGSLALGGLALSAALITFGMWWLYFSDSDHLKVRDPKETFLWGYGHIIVFASAAATGAGIAAAVDALAHESHASPLATSLATSLPVSLYMAGLWLVRDRTTVWDRRRWVLLIGAAASLATSWLPYPLEALAAVVLGVSIARTVLSPKA